MVMLEDVVMVVVKGLSELHVGDLLKMTMVKVMEVAVWWW